MAQVSDAANGADAKSDKEYVWTKLGEGGRIVLPVGFRKALGLCVGDDVFIERDGCEIRLYSRDGAISKVQANLRRYVPEGVSLVDELIAERRAETAREFGEPEQPRG